MRKTTSKDKITLEKYFVIAERMRTSGNFMLDISKYEPKELEIIGNLVQSDAIFRFVKETKDIDVRKLKAIMEYLDAEEKMIKARTQF